MKEEVQRAKELTSNFLYWAVAQTTDGTAHLNDPALKVAGAKKKKGSARRSRNAFRC